MAIDVKYYCGHKFIYDSLSEWKYQCKKCGYYSNLTGVMIKENLKILSCDESIIKNIIE